MTALDTNILARYMTQDDEKQAAAVLHMLCRKGATFFVSDLVLVELDWILGSLYSWTRDEIAEGLARLTTVHNLVFDDEARALAALKAMRSGADLSDELLVGYARDRGCKEMASFDAGMKRRHPGFVICPE